MESMDFDLQYTLLLLILSFYVCKFRWCARFTIHFATINTFFTPCVDFKDCHLQYTLLLLIPC